MFGSHKIKEFKNEAREKSEKFLNMILKEIEEQKDASKKELNIVINPSVAIKIDEAYLINALRRRKLKVHKQKDEMIGACAFKVIWD